jgi:uncharacterized membrane protein YcaP (DUF421 family)
MESSEVGHFGNIGTVGHVLFELVIIFAIALVVVRLMGNRTVGQFSPFDFVLMVGIGDIVGNVALDRQTNLFTGAEALLGVLILQKLLSWSSLKSRVLRKWFEGTPVELIENGQILKENLTKTQFNLDDLRQELHKQGLDFADIQNIKLARLESCGDFSIIKADDMEPLTKRDLKNFITSLSENPLSPQGTGWAKLDQLATDVRELTEYIKNQPQAAAAKAPPVRPPAEDLQ